MSSIENNILKILREEVWKKYFVVTTNEYPTRELITSDFEKLKNIIDKFLQEKAQEECESLIIPKSDTTLTFSITTLKRFFKSDFVVNPKKPDPRRIKSLDILCSFVGYENWQQYRAIRIKSLEKYDDETETIKQLQRIVYDGVKAELNAYCNLPKLNLNELKKYFTQYALFLILTRLKQLSKYDIKAGGYNLPSKCTIDNIKTIKQEDEFVSEVTLLRVYWWYQNLGYLGSLVEHSTFHFYYAKEGENYKICNIVKYHPSEETSEFMNNFDDIEWLTDNSDWFKFTEQE